MVKEYKGSLAFLEELVDGFVDANRFRFTESKDKVAQAFSELDLSNVINIDLENQEEDGKGVVDADGAKLLGSKEVTTETAIAKATGNVEEVIAEATIEAPKANSTGVTEGPMASLEK